MQVFVREPFTMIAAPVQCDVDGIPKGSHFARVPPMGYTGNVSLTGSPNPRHITSAEQIPRVLFTLASGSGHPTPLLPIASRGSPSGVPDSPLLSPPSSVMIRLVNSPPPRLPKGGKENSG